MNGPVTFTKAGVIAVVVVAIVVIVFRVTGRGYVVRASTPAWEVEVRPGYAGSVAQQGSSRMLTEAQTGTAHQQPGLGARP